MALLRFFTQLTLASSALATPLDTDRRHGNKSNCIKWGPCDFENAGTRPIECGTLDVPLDYTDGTSKEKLTLSLIKSSAPIKTATKKKSILFNFGGPGFGSVETLNLLADLLHACVRPRPVLPRDHELTISQHVGRHARLGCL
jgi:hypothetical protein